MQINLQTTLRACIASRSMSLHVATDTRCFGVVRCSPATQSGAPFPSGGQPDAQLSPMVEDVLDELGPACGSPRLSTAVTGRAAIYPTTFAACSASAAAFAPVGGVGARGQSLSSPCELPPEECERGQHSRPRSSQVDRDHHVRICKQKNLSLCRTRAYISCSGRTARGGDSQHL